MLVLLAREGQKMKPSRKTYKRRKFFKKTAITATAAIVGTTAPALSQNRQQWRMVSSWPERFPDQYVAAERLARRITAMSDGQLTVSVVPPGEWGDNQEILNVVSSGEVEMCRSLSYNWRDRGFAFDIFTFVPFGMNELERVVWLQNFDGQQLWDALYADLGVKPFLCGSVGPQAFGWFANSITSVEQLKGLRYRTTGINGVIMERLGAIPSGMGVAEIGPAIQSGELDAFEFVSPVVDMEYGLDKFLPVYIYPSFHQTTGSSELVINLQAWQRLPNNLKQIVEVAAQAEHEANLADVYASNTRALEILRQDPNIRIEILSDRVLTAIGNVTGEVLKEIREQSSGEHRRIFDSFLAARQSLMSWTSITESAFLAARQLPYRYL